MPNKFGLISVPMQFATLFSILDHVLALFASKSKKQHKNSKEFIGTRENSEKLKGTKGTQKTQSN